MSLNQVQLLEQAHKLALEHVPHGKRITANELRRRLQADLEGLRSFLENLHGGRSACEQPAEEWLLDHAEFLEAELLELDDALSQLKTRALPVVRPEETLRVSSLSRVYLEQTDGLLDEETLVAFVNAYQEVAVLSIAEAWLLPLFLRMEMVRRLAALAEPVRERRAMCERVDRMLDGVPAAELSPERLKALLDEHRVELPMSGAFTVHLIRHLREHADDTAHLGEWLVCKMDNAPESLDAILSYEYRLQAEYQVSIGNVIGSLRKLSRLLWSELFEEIGAVEQTLRLEQAGDYPKLDGGSRQTLRHRVELLARRMGVPEKLVAVQAVELANAGWSAWREGGGLGDGENAGAAGAAGAASAADAIADAGAAVGLPPRDAFAAYYLLDGRGLRRLQQALRQCSEAGALPEAGLRRRAAGFYMQVLAVATLAALALLLWWIGSSAAPLSALGWMVVGLGILWPAGDLGVTAVHWLIERTVRPIRVLRYDFSKGVPVEASTMVVIPVIWSSAEDVRGTADRLELHHLANRDPNIHFAILSDYRDAQEERLPDDEMLLHAARIEIERLNAEYPDSTFHHFHRDRRWNASEQVWMGWERKRGKLEEFVSLLQGDGETSFTTRIGDASVLGRIRYLLTLDADTRLPLESAHRMIGAMHLPYNRPRLDAGGTRVEEGYGILQPRIGVTYESAQKSRLTALWVQQTGLDPYAFAVSDPYQDTVGHGIFTGKGILDVQAFHKVLGGRFPENRVLSHDLLEGGLLRTGFLSDIELIDDHPPTFFAHQKRLHRWTRGDWQLLPWLRRRVRNTAGARIASGLNAMTRWQLADNLRRSLLPPVLTSLLLLAPVLPGSALRWYGVVLLTLLLPFLRQLLTWSTLRHRPWSLVIALGHALLAFMTLPFQSALLLDAVGRTLYRLGVSKRRLLQWVNQAQVEKQSSGANAASIAGAAGGWTLIAILAISAYLSGSAAVQTAGSVTALLWAAAPLLIRFLDQAPEPEPEPFTAEEAETLRGLAKDIWMFYEDYVTAEDRWLPPDNVQFEPDRGIAHRTSPTNIGMYVTCALAARDFGFIDTPGLLDRLERTLTTIERMEKWEGHLYNWYDTRTLEPLLPVYVSTVDSGNMAASLMTVKEGVLEWCRADRDRKIEPIGPVSAPERGRREVAFADELGQSPPPGDLMLRGSRVAARIEALVQATDFRPLYDPKTNLLALGYHVHPRIRDGVLYDLLASEARQASFVAIALGQVSVSHWNALGRTLTKVGERPALLSWSATMFEYLMPWLLMKTYRHSIWDSTYKAVVGRQIEYAAQQGVPFGISESGYYAFDHQLNYQYRAFGVPGLGFKRGLEQDLVLAPYATVMALPYAPREGLDALRRMEELGARGRYGYYEAIDFTPRRMRAGHRHEVIRSFMAHHQGMSLLTLSNLLLPQRMQERFHRNQAVRAAELLLQERIPTRPKWVKHPALSRSPIREEQAAPPAEPLRELASPHTALPEAVLLSNGRFTSMVTASGGGYTSWEGRSVTRWREDPVQDAWGSWLYIRDVRTERLWSPSYMPTRTEAGKQRIVFEADKATFQREDDTLETRLEITVSPDSDAELRRLRLTNRGTESELLEVTTYVELALSNAIADDAHLAFSKLFIRTAYDSESGCLVASRRKREAKDLSLWSAHLLIAEGQPPAPAEFETDRAAFLGRGFRAAEPQAIRSRLQGRTGSVADPAFVMRRRVHVKPGETVHLYAVTSVAETREEAVDIVRRLANAPAAERTFQLSWTRSRVELRNLGLSPDEAIDFQRLASQVLYTPPVRPDRADHIAGNAKGQPGLWSFGISGDRPLIAVLVDNRSQLPFVLKLLTGHEYLRRLGLPFDLLLLNQSADGYQQSLQESLDRAVEHGVDRFGQGAVGIRVLQERQLAEEDRTLLLAVARVVLRAGGASLRGQLRQPRRKPDGAASSRGLAVAAGRKSVDAAAGPGDERWPEQLARPRAAADAPAWPAPASLALDASHVRFFNGWGGFSPDGRAYRLLVRDRSHLPAPWINVLANPTFGTLVSELGTGYTFWRNSRECKLTPWSNDPVLDPPGELGFLRDETSGDWWTLVPGGGAAAEPYRVTHGLGYTAFEHERAGIRHTLTMFVPPDDPIKVMRLKLTNTSSARRELSVTYYAEWVLGVQRPTNAPFIVSEWDEAASILTARNTYQENFREATAFLGLFVPDQPARPEADDLSWTASQLEFLGRNGTIDRPAAMERIRLSREAGVSHASCGAVQRKLRLEPGQEAEVLLLLGCAASSLNAAELARRYAEPARCEEAWKETQAYWDRTLGQIEVETPSPETDLLLNGWLLYQSLACRMWARTAFYQAGGAYGFRDQLQDSLALLHTAPEFTRRQIVRHASHQYEEGDVQHWWHEETERGIRTLFSDDLLWLPYVTSRYVEHTGDASILDEPAAYIKSEPLRPGEHERYEPTVLSEQRGTIYEHGVRAIERSLQRIGEHGLPLIGVGDWNDGMNLVGDEGRGESVWLGWFLCDVLQRFEPLCRERGEPDRADRYAAMRERIAEAIQEHGWDGQWYRRALTDNGSWLGSVYNEECRIDAIAQSWSVISGAAPAERAQQAMHAFDRELVDRELRVAKLLTPPFDRTDPSPGYIQGYPPGIRENGAQYTHGVIWSIVAWAKLRRGDKAFELFRLLNPVNHTRTDQEVRQYYGEPYVMAADVYTSEPHRGHAGWTWYTGASGWMYQSGIEWILGLRRQGSRLILDPCVPSDWPGFRATYRFGDTPYRLIFSRSSAAEGASQLTAGPETYIELVDDGTEREYHIQL